MTSDPVVNSSDPDSSWRHIRDHVRASLSSSVSSQLDQRRHDIIDRLHTYTRQWWPYTHPLLSPLICSRLGWTCSAHNMLYCQSCHRRCMIQFHDRLHDQSLEHAIQSAAFMLHNRHQPDCIMSRQSLTNIRLIPWNSDAVNQQYHQRYQSISHIDMNDIQLVSVPSQLQTISDIQSIISICGWSISPSNNNILQCSICARQVQIAFNNKRSASVVSTQARSSKRSRHHSPDRSNMEISHQHQQPIFRIGERVPSLSEMPSPGLDLFGHQTPISSPSNSSSINHRHYQLDPIGDHRQFCPWIISDSQEMSGWQRCLQVRQRNMEEDCHDPIDYDISILSQSCANTVRTVQRMHLE